MPSFRHLSRQLVFQALFAEHYQPDEQSGFLQYMIDNFGINLPDVKFAKDLHKAVNDSMLESEELIQEYAPEWPLDKIAVADKLILCLGLTEILYFQQAPALVAINEAIELAKEFGTENSSKFINAVLSKVAEAKLGAQSLSKPKANAQ